MSNYFDNSKGRTMHALHLKRGTTGPFLQISMASGYGPSEWFGESMWDG